MGWFLICVVPAKSLLAREMLAIKQHPNHQPTVMKQIALSLLIAAVVLISFDCSARKPKADTAVVLFQQLLTMIADGTHYDESNLVNIGMEQLIKSVEQDEEEPVTYIYFVYGNSVTATQVEDEDGCPQLQLNATDKHAHAIEVHLDTDNGTNLYFKEQADHDAFMQCLRNSSKYSANQHEQGVTEYIGGALIESDTFTNGWYVISFHGDY